MPKEWVYGLNTCQGKAICVLRRRTVRVKVQVVMMIVTVYSSIEFP